MIGTQTQRPCWVVQSGGTAFLGKLTEPLMIGTQTQRPCWVVQSGGTAFLGKLTEPLIIGTQTRHPCLIVKPERRFASKSSGLTRWYQTLQVNNKPTFVGFFVPVRKQMTVLEVETLHAFIATR